MLVVQPYDKSSIRCIERAIQEADLGLNPSNDGNVIRSPFPPLTEERRRDLIKVVHRWPRTARVAVANVRGTPRTPSKPKTCPRTTSTG